MKVCSGCGDELPLDMFDRDSSKKSGYRARCKRCTALYREQNREAIRQWHNNHRKLNGERLRARQNERYDPHKKAAYLLRRRYGLTPEEYNILLDKQGGVCALCGSRPKRGKRLVVDHDHGTNEIRGLLCDSCNYSLGVFGDSIEGLEKAIAYLKQAKVRVLAP